MYSYFILLQLFEGKQGEPASYSQPLFPEWPMWVTWRHLLLNPFSLKPESRTEWGTAFQSRGTFLGFLKSLYLLWEQNTKYLLSDAFVKKSCVEMLGLRSKALGKQLGVLILVTGKSLLKCSCSSEMFQLWCNGVFDKIPLWQCSGQVYVFGAFVFVGEELKQRELIDKK